MHNASSYHALPALVSGLHQTMGALSSNGTGPTFAVKSHPLPLTSEESVQLDSLLMVKAPVSPDDMILLFSPDVDKRVLLFACVPSVGRLCNDLSCMARLV